MEPILILLNSPCQQLRDTVEQLAATDANVNVHLLPNEKIRDVNIPHADGYVAISHSGKTCRILRKKIIARNDNSFFIQVADADDESLFEHADLFIQPTVDAVRLAVRCALKQIRLQNKVFAFNIHSVTKEGGMRESSETQSASQQKRFMMMVNHELRTPATIISTSLEMLQMKAEGMNATENRFLENAMDGSRRLNTLLQNLMLALPKPPAVTHSGGSVPLSSLLTDLQNNYQPTLFKRNVRLRVDCPDKLQVSGDAASLRKLFDELLSNAVKYTPSGSNILLQARLYNGSVAVDIQDGGIGIPKNRLGKIFRPFYQHGNAMRHHSSKTEFMGAGMGLGLAVCKNIIAAHGGQIKAGSLGEGRGTIISFTLPRAPGIDRQTPPGYRLAV